MNNRNLFLLTFLITFGGSLFVFYLGRPKDSGHRKPSVAPTLTKVSDTILLTPQLRPADVQFLMTSGIKTIIDIRPDGEAPDQPPSAQMRAAADNLRLSFHYIPVPHEAIPDTAVENLTTALVTAERPIVMYCRTGRRAVRLLALAEASRLEGDSLERILQMVTTAGFTAEDLRDQLVQRIAARRSQTNPEK